MKQYNCPNCGDVLNLHFQSAKMTTCESCSTSLFIEDGQLENAGSSGNFHTSPLLIKLSDQVMLSGSKFNILGHVRFDYGLGWWDEFWALDAQGDGAWISIDEGEVILQRPCLDTAAPKMKRPPKLGDTVKAVWGNFRVVEADVATCIAVRGDFPEVLRVGQTYSFVNCTNEHGDLLSGEFVDGSSEWYKGVWIDPFDVTVVNRQ